MKSKYRYKAGFNYLKASEGGPGVGYQVRIINKYHKIPGVRAYSLSSVYVGHSLFMVEAVTLKAMKKALSRLKKEGYGDLNMSDVERI